MKNANVLIKLVAAILVVSLTAVLFTGCKASQEVVMSFKAENGTTYTITEEELALFMKVRKRLFFYSYFNCTLSYDTQSFWAADSGEKKDSGDGNKTNEQYYKDLIVEQLMSVLVEKYLFEANNLSLTKETQDNFKKNMKTDVTNYGGKGSYKQYFGYTADDYYNIYENMVAKSGMLLEHLCKEGALLEVNDADMEQYYTDNYVGYQYIVLDLVNKVVRDEEGNRVVEKTKDEEGKEIDGDTYKTEKLTDEEKEKKQTLAESILKELGNGKSFEELVQEYSDEYYSVEYPEGWFVDKESTFINATVAEKVKDLEIGEHTAKVIESGNYRYIVKRVELKDKVYEDTDENEYAEFFEGFKDSVEYDKYETYVKGFFGEIQIVDAILNSYTVADTYLNKKSELYRDLLYYRYGYFYPA